MKGFVLILEKNDTNVNEEIKGPTLCTYTVLGTFTITDVHSNNVFGRLGKPKAYTKIT